MILDLHIENQTLNRRTHAHETPPRRGSAEYLWLKFTFSEDWADLTKTVYFQAGEYSEPIILESDTILVPKYFTQQESFDVSLVGIRGTKIVPTSVVKILLKESNTVWEETPPDTEIPAYAQLINLAEKAVESAKAPYVGENGHWYVYNSALGEWEDSGVTAVGRDGDDYVLTEADKKAIKKELSDDLSKDFVKKGSKNNALYGVYDNAEVQLPFSSGTVEPYSIARRTSVGNLLVSTPERSDAATNKAYVDKLAFLYAYIDQSGNLAGTNIPNLDTITALFSRVHKDPKSCQLFYIDTNSGQSAPISIRSRYNKALYIGCVIGMEAYSVTTMLGYWYHTNRVSWTAGYVEGYNPCLVEGTPINMADGTTKAIESVKSGDIVQSYDPATKEIVPAVVIQAYETGRNRDFTVYNFSNGKHLTVYGVHGIYNSRSGITKDIQNVTRDDRFVTLSGEEVQWAGSRSMLFAGAKKKRYNIITSNNLYFANGILLGVRAHTKLQYALDRGIPLSEEIQTEWQKDCDDYNAYEEFLNDPSFYAEVAEDYQELAKARNIIRVNKKRLADTDYQTQKHTEGVLSDEEWSKAKDKRARFRKEINDSEEVMRTRQARVDTVIAKHRGDWTPRSIFEACCTRNNALFETVKAYFAPKEED